MSTRVKHVAGKKYSFLLPLSIGVSVLISSIISLVMILLVTVILTNMNDIPYSVIDFVIVGVQVISSLIGGILAVKLYKRRGLLVGAISGLVFFAVLLLVGTVLLNNTFELKSVITLVILTISGAIGGVLGNKNGS